jgi:hypothetical protein
LLDGMGANHPATRPQSSAPALSLTLSEPAPLSLPLCLSLPLFLSRFCALSFSFTRSSTSSPSSKSCTMRSRSDYRLLFLILFGRLRRCRFFSFSLHNARSIFLSLALPLNRQAQRRVQSVRALTTACCFSYSLGACAAVASSLSLSLLRALFFFHSLFHFIAKLIVVYSTMHSPIDYR